VCSRYPFHKCACGRRNFSSEGQHVKYGSVHVSGAPSLKNEQLFLLGLGIQGRSELSEGQLRSFRLVFVLLDQPDDTRKRPGLFCTAGSCLVATRQPEAPRL